MALSLNERRSLSFLRVVLDANVDLPSLSRGKLTFGMPSPYSSIQYPLALCSFCSTILMPSGALLLKVLVPIAGTFDPIELPLVCGTALLALVFVYRFFDRHRGTVDQIKS